MGNTYHSGTLAPPYRVQKRLVLNRCFRKLRDSVGHLADIAYVTFGGADLYDVLDLMLVFDVTTSNFKVLSFELDSEVVLQAKNCPVSTTLSKIENVSITIVPANFPDGLGHLLNRDSRKPVWYYLDYTGVFKRHEREDLESILMDRQLRAGDVLMITSCLTPRVVHQRKFMIEQLTSFELIYKQAAAAIDSDFKVRNHVDLLVYLAASKAAGSLRDQGHEFCYPRLVCKIRYNDSTPMGMWMFRLEDMESQPLELSDVQFDDYPAAFTYEEPEDEQVPNIFDET